MLKPGLLIPIILLFFTADLVADEIAVTRPEMKKKLEALKSRTSRLHLPPLTPEEIASGRRSVNNGRLRSLYLPDSWRSFVISGWGGTRRSSDRTSKLNQLQKTSDYGFKTRLFWVVSRSNDCQYCLGHQELKLKRVGMTDDEVAALDGLWERFPASEQAALQATRQLTVSPHQMDQLDLKGLRKHFEDAEIIDLIYTVARYNNVNRWTSATGIPQDQSFGGSEPSVLDTPTSSDFTNITSKVAPLDVSHRPAWESWEQFENQLRLAREREPALKIPTVRSAALKLVEDTPGVIPPQWFVALSDLPIALDAWAQRQALVREGTTSPNLRIKIAWVTARENRAWYAAGHAWARAQAAQMTSETLQSFDQLVESSEADEAQALKFARKLTSLPHKINDADVQALKSYYSDQEIAEIIQLVADANAFDRFSEALNLPLED